MIIYANTISPRLQYVTSFLSRYYSHDFKLTSSQEEFVSSKEGRINYTSTRISADELLIVPAGLLEEKGIHAIEPAICPVGGSPALFINISDTGFDVFSAIFYLLSRYEEYLPHKLDDYGRYAHENSIAYRERFLQKPLINLWLKDLAGKVKTFTHVALQQPAFSYTPTYDIDIAWSYRRKGILRNAGGLLRSVWKRDWQSVKERVAVLSGRADDPFNSYDWMRSVHKEHQLEPVYFFHVGIRRNRYDKNIPASDPEMRRLIQKIASENDVGIHPSWQSGDESVLVVEEKKLLESITGRQITRSRQHYIRLNLPHTYRLLLANGITDDYSMGYGSINGFRASIGSSFYWYDLEKEEATTLLIHPFCFMEANSFYEQGYTPVQAFEEMIAYMQALQNTGGEMITIWHNDLLGEKFQEWRSVYAGFLARLR